MALLSNGKVRRSREEWGVIVEGYEGSGLSQAEYCAREEISGKWYRLVKGARQSSGVKVSGDKFIQLKGREHERGEFNADQMSEVELVFKSGTVLRIRG